MINKIALSIVLLLLIVGCSAPTGQQPTLTAIVLPQTPRLFVTKESPPTSTFTPISTDIPTQAPISTMIPSPSPTADLAAMVVASQQPMLYASYPSPDGMWRMDIYIYDCVKTIEGNENAYEQLILVDLAGGEEQVAAEQLQYCGGLGAYGFDGRYWSPNSRYFYYTDARQGGPDGCGYWEPPLSRFDIATLQDDYLGLGSLSPDGSKIATLDPSEGSLAIWDINNGVINRFLVYTSGGGVGPIAWSPDSQSLVYLQVDSWCPLSGKSYLFFVDLSKSIQTQLLKSENPTFGNVEWDVPDEPRLFDQNLKEWWYNINTSELTQMP